MTIKSGTPEHPCVIVLNTQDVKDNLHMMFSPDMYDFTWEHKDGPVTLKRLRWVDDVSYIEAQYGCGPNNGIDPWGPEDEGICPCGGVSCDGTCDGNRSDPLSGGPNGDDETVELHEPYVILDPPEEPVTFEDPSDLDDLPF